MYNGITLDDIDEEEVACDLLENDCPLENHGDVYWVGDMNNGGLSDGPCWWKRKLCVMCKQLPGNFFSTN